MRAMNPSVAHARPHVGNISSAAVHEFALTTHLEDGLLVRCGEQAEGLVRVERTVVNDVGVFDAFHHEVANERISGVAEEADPVGIVDGVVVTGLRVRHDDTIGGRV